MNASVEIINMQALQQIGFLTFCLLLIAVGIGLFILIYQRLHS